MTTICLNAETLGVSFYEGDFDDAVAVAAFDGNLVVADATELFELTANGIEQVSWHCKTGDLQLLPGQTVSVGVVSVLARMDGEMRVEVIAHEDGEELTQTEFLPWESVATLTGQLVPLAGDVSGDAWSVELSGESEAAIDELLIGIGTNKRAWRIA